MVGRLCGVVYVVGRLCGVDCVVGMLCGVICVGCLCGMKAVWICL